MEAPAGAKLRGGDWEACWGYQSVVGQAGAEEGVVGGVVYLVLQQRANDTWTVCGMKVFVLVFLDDLIIVVLGYGKLRWKGLLIEARGSAPKVI